MVTIQLGIGARRLRLVEVDESGEKVLVEFPVDGKVQDLKISSAISKSGDSGYVIEAATGRAAPRLGKTADVPTPAKRRGRPPKSEAAAVPAATDGEAPPKRRGRPPKVRTEAELAAAAEPKRRGRPPKAKPEATAEAGAVPPKRRGRPPKVRPEAEQTPSPVAAAEAPEAAAVAEAPAPAPEKVETPKLQKPSELEGVSLGKA